jgi:hypothetical protein
MKRSSWPGSFKQGRDNIDCGIAKGSFEATIKIIHEKWNLLPENFKSRSTTVAGD